ncbi:MAG: DUF551 domain-containing protein [Oscillospiraceae bacterium]|nr:DUF551 domain-containing protein [Oscillospiraceae bacterium]
MNERKFTPEEIAKSLRACIEVGGGSASKCHLCALHGRFFECDCFDELNEQAADMIEAQAKRIGELEAELAKLREENRWVPVEERKPDPETRVWVMAERRTNKGTYNVATTGMYEDGSVWREDSSWYWEEDFLSACNAEYDEDRDDWKVPEGWYEYCVYNEDGKQGAIDDFVTHWKPMPKGPEVGHE